MQVCIPRSFKGLNKNQTVLFDDSGKIHHAATFDHAFQLNEHPCTSQVPKKVLHAIRNSAASIWKTTPRSTSVHKLS